jgi:hypothetical protein
MLAMAGSQAGVEPNIRTYVDHRVMGLDQFEENFGLVGLPAIFGHRRITR